MLNNIYISFSAENSSSDAWASELLNSLKITLGKISSFPVSIYSGLEKDSDPEKQIKEANIVILVFNGFVSDEFAKDLRILELCHHELISAGKEIFVVAKSNKFAPIIPVYLRKYSQYNFYDINIRTNEIVEYTPLFKGEKENKFWSKLTDLAYDSKMFFDNLREGDGDEKKPVVYLAEVSKDQVSNREILKREFLLSGFNVLPVKPLPPGYKEYYETASGLIERAEVSIHIMGEVYGDSPSGSDYSYTEIQNKIISELLNRQEHIKETFYRFIWLPPNLEPYDEKQVQYLKRLKRELSDSRQSEIIQCTIEEFKELFIQKINQVVSYDLQKIIDNEEKRIVLITDNSDQSIYYKIENQLRESNKPYELIDLSKSGDLLPLTMFRQKLKIAKGAIVLNLTKDAYWVQGMVNLTIKNLQNNSGESSVAAISSIDNKTAIDFEALKVDFLYTEDDQLLKNVEKFLIQLN